MKPTLLDYLLFYNFIQYSIYIVHYTKFISFYQSFFENIFNFFGYLSIIKAFLSF